ncbi:MAG: T9SS type A sorting domain-containing protein [Bacteroidota bacterium]|jgi:polyhydroxybutyrate depolymerase
MKVKRKLKTKLGQTIIGEMKNKILLTITLFSLENISYGQDIYDSIYVGSYWRKYNIHLPLGYNPNTNYPLILGFHGGQQAATSSEGWTVFAYQSKLSEKADNSGFIVVYPEGLVFNKNRSWNAGNCCPPAMNQGVDDVGFIDSTLNKLFKKYSIDRNRVYATGSSNGGMMCYRLACELSHRIAAIAPNASSQMYYPCNPANKIPIISFHSKVDPIVFYTGGMGGAPPLTAINFPAQDSTMNFWSHKNNCQTRDTIINGNGTNYDFIKIHNCSCNAEIHHYATTDGSHSWPGGNPNNNPVSTQISATDLLWSFFKNYTLGCLKTGIENTNQKKTNIAVSPNPFSNTINITNTTGKEEYTLLNYFGQVIWAGNNIEQQNFSYLSNGLYFLRVDNRTIKLVKQ